MKSFTTLLNTIEQSGLRIIHFQSASIICPKNDDNPKLELPIIVLRCNPGYNMIIEKYDTLENYLNKDNVSIRLFVNKWPVVTRTYIIASQLIRKDRIKLQSKE